MTPTSALTTLEGGAARGEAIRFWREPRYDDLECLSAVFRTHRYARHTHETYAIAAIVDGCEAFFHRGVRHYAKAGSIAVVCPDEVHDGEPAEDHFVYRTLYPSVELMRSVAEDVFDRPVHGTPSYAGSVMHDPGLAAELAELHGVLARPETSLLERDTRMTAFLARLVRTWSSGVGGPVELGASAAVVRAREFLEAHFEEEVTLEQLARVARLNRAHLVRAFHKAVGLSPHAYLLDRRFRAARRRLLAGGAPAEVATSCGFYDQSHLNRVFKARMGVTPGQFRVSAPPLA